MNPFKIEAINDDRVGGSNGIASFVYWSCEDISGIPLTEEWLLKFGFEKNFINCWRHNDGFYVHQFQNLYYALTGEELTLKETVNA